MDKGKFLPTNCPNCGAVLSNGKCEYCGTRVMFPNTVDAIADGWYEITLNIKHGDSVSVLPLVGYIDEIRFSENAETYIANDCKYMSCCMCRDVEFHFSGRLIEKGE